MKEVHRVNSKGYNKNRSTLLGCQNAPFRRVFKIIVQLPITHNSNGYVILNHMRVRQLILFDQSTLQSFLLFIRIIIVVIINALINLRHDHLTDVILKQEVNEIGDAGFYGNISLPFLPFTESALL